MYDFPANSWSYLVPVIFHTLLPPCHPYIAIHFMEMIFSTCSTIFFDAWCGAYYKKKQPLLYHAYKYQPCFHGTSLHLTEISQLTDNISLCSYLVEHTYLSAFYNTIIIVMIKKAVVIMVILFECVV